MATITLFILGSSAAIAVIPLLPHFEDTFVNALYLPEIDFLRGFASKRKLVPTLASYYVRIRLEVSNLSWNSLASLINGMFTNNYGGISQRFLGFYGNDPVCLFKFFVSPDEPQATFSWFILTANLICFGEISISYLIVSIITSTSSSSLSEGATGDHVRNRNLRLQRKVSVIILTDFLCWVPFIIICLLHTKEVVDASPWYALLSILILPINSVINPLLYDDTIGRILARILARIFRMARTETALERKGQDIPVFREARQAASPEPLDASGETGQTMIAIQLSSAKESGKTTTPRPTSPDVDGEPKSVLETNFLKLEETTVY